MPEIGQTIFVRNSDHLGDGPDWVPAIVTDAHTSAGGSMQHKQADVFSCTVFYPQLTQTRPYDFYFGEDHGKTWREDWLPGPGVLEDDVDGEE